MQKTFESADLSTPQCALSPPENSVPSYPRGKSNRNYSMSPANRGSNKNLYPTQRPTSKGEPSSSTQAWSHAGLDNSNNSWEDWSSTRSTPPIKTDPFHKPRNSGSYNSEWSSGDSSASGTMAPTYGTMQVSPPNPLSASYENSNNNFYGGGYSYVQGGYSQPPYGMVPPQPYPPQLCGTYSRSPSSGPPKVANFQQKPTLDMPPVRIKPEPIDYDDYPPQRNDAAESDNFSSVFTRSLTSLYYQDTEDNNGADVIACTPARDAPTYHRLNNVSQYPAPPVANPYQEMRSSFDYFSMPNPPAENHPANSNSDMPQNQMNSFRYDRPSFDDMHLYAGSPNESSKNQTKKRKMNGPNPPPDNNFSSQENRKKAPRLQTFRSESIWTPNSLAFSDIQIKPEPMDDYGINDLDSSRHSGQPSPSTPTNEINGSVTPQPAVVDPPKPAPRKRSPGTTCFDRFEKKSTSTSKKVSPLSVYAKVQDSLVISIKCRRYKKRTKPAPGKEESVVREETANSLTPEQVSHQVIGELVDRVSLMQERRVMNGPDLSLLNPMDVKKLMMQFCMHNSMDYREFENLDSVLQSSIVTEDTMTKNSDRASAIQKRTSSSQVEPEQAKRPRRTRGASKADSSSSPLAETRVLRRLPGRVDPPTRSSSNDVVKKRYSTRGTKEVEEPDIVIDSSTECDSEAGKEAEVRKKKNTQPVNASSARNAVPKSQKKNEEKCPKTDENTTKRKRSRLQRVGSNDRSRSVSIEIVEVTKKEPAKSRTKADQKTSKSSVSKSKEASEEVSPPKKQTRISADRSILSSFDNAAALLTSINASKSVEKLAKAVPSPSPKDKDVKLSNPKNSKVVNSSKKSTSAKKELENSKKPSEKSGPTKVKNSTKNLKPTDDDEVKSNSDKSSSVLPTDKLPIKRSRRLKTNPSKQRFNVSYIENSSSDESVSPGKQSKSVPKNNSVEKTKANCNDDKPELKQDIPSNEQDNKLIKIEPLPVSDVKVPSSKGVSKNSLKNLKDSKIEKLPAISDSKQKSNSIEKHDSCNPKLKDAKNSPPSKSEQDMEDYSKKQPMSLLKKPQFLQAEKFKNAFKNESSHPVVNEQKPKTTRKKQPPESDEPKAGLMDLSRVKQEEQPSEENGASSVAPKIIVNGSIAPGEMIEMETAIKENVKKTMAAHSLLQLRASPTFLLNKKKAAMLSATRHEKSRCAGTDENILDRSRDSENILDRSRDSGNMLDRSRDSGNMLDRSRDSENKLGRSRDSEDMMDRSRDSGNILDRSRDSENRLGRSRDSEDMVNRSRDSENRLGRSRDSENMLDRSRDSENMLDRSRDSENVLGRSRDSGKLSDSARVQNRRDSRSRHFGQSVRSELRKRDDLITISSDSEEDSNRMPFQRPRRLWDPRGKATEVAQNLPFKPISPPTELQVVLQKLPEVHSVSVSAESMRTWEQKDRRARRESNDDQPPKLICMADVKQENSSPRPKDHHPPFIHSFVGPDCRRSKGVHRLSESEDSENRLVIDLDSPTEEKVSLPPEEKCPDLSEEEAGHILLQLTRSGQSVKKEESVGERDESILRTLLLEAGPLATQDFPKPELYPPSFCTEMQENISKDLMSLLNQNSESFVSSYHPVSSSSNNNFTQLSDQIRKTQDEIRYLHFMLEQKKRECAAIIYYRRYKEGLLQNALKKQPEEKAPELRVTTDQRSTDLNDADLPLSRQILKLALQATLKMESLTTPPKTEPTEYGVDLRTFKRSNILKNALSASQPLALIKNTESSSEESSRRQLKVESPSILHPSSLPKSPTAANTSHAHLLHNVSLASAIASDSRLEDPKQLLYGPSKKASMGSKHKEVPQLLKPTVFATLEGKSEKPPKKTFNGLYKTDREEVLVPYNFPSPLFGKSPLEIRTPLSPPKCNGCGRPGAIFLCSGCGRQWYCSAQCQNMMWPEHGTNCNGRLFNPSTGSGQT